MQEIVREFDEFDESELGSKKNKNKTVEELKGDLIKGANYTYSKAKEAAKTVYNKVSEMKR